MKPANYAPVYMAGVYPRWAEIARAHGYALAVHGSCASDLDVVFMPWVEKVSAPSDVIHDLCDEFAVKPVGGLTPKNHGRLCQTLSWMGDCYADISFMPSVPSAALRPTIDREKLEEIRARHERTVARTSAGIPIKVRLSDVAALLAMLDGGRE